MTYPTIRPSLTLDFKKSKQLDPRVTFSRSSTATYVEAGVVKTAPSNVARFEKKGLLLEESRTNILTQSVTMTDWTATAQLSLNQAVAPDSTNTATKLYQTNAVDGDQFQQVSGRFGTNYADQVFSIFVKAAENNYFFVRNHQGNDWAILDLTDGTVTGSRQVYLDAAISVQPFGNGWDRIKQETGSSGIHIFQTWGISPSKSVSAAADLEFTGDGTSGVYVWGAQIEDQTRIMTSYIPTAGSTVTRSADVSQITVNSFSPWYNQNEGTITYEYCAIGDSQFLSPASIRASNSQDAPSWGFWLYASGRPIAGKRNGGDEQLRLANGNPSTTIPLNTTYTVAVAHDNNTLSAIHQGWELQSRNITPVPTMTELGIGYITRNWNNYFTGHICRLSYYSDRLTDAQLQEITK